MKPINDVILELADGKYVRILNLSVGGVGLYPEPLEHLQKDTLEGHLIIAKKRVPVTLLVAHRSEEIIGCRFEKVDEILKNQIDHFFESVLASLKLTRAEKLSESKESKDVEKTTFYRGQNNCEFTVLEKNSQLVSFSIILFGNYLEYAADTGLTVAQSFEKTPNKGGVSLFKRMEKPAIQLMQVAAKFAQRIEGLADPVRKQIFGILDEGMRQQTKAGHEF